MISLSIGLPSWHGSGALAAILEQASLGKTLAYADIVTMGTSLKR